MSEPCVIEAGDVILHVPSGEEWWLWRVEKGRVYAGGWPPSSGLLSDCELVAKGIDQDRADAAAERRRFAGREKT